jgi:hypothetical protein
MGMIVEHSVEGGILGLEFESDGMAVDILQACIVDLYFILFVHIVFVSNLAC